MIVYSPLFFTVNRIACEHRWLRAIGWHDERFEYPVSNFFDTAAQQSFFQFKTHSALLSHNPQDQLRHFNKFQWPNTVNPALTGGIGIVRNGVFLAILVQQLYLIINCAGKTIQGRPQWQPKPALCRTPKRELYKHTAAK